MAGALVATGWSFGHGDTVPAARSAAGVPAAVSAAATVDIGPTLPTPPHTPDPRVDPAPALTPRQRAACPATSSACVDLAAHVAWLQRDGRVTRGPVWMLPGTETGRVAPGPTSSATPRGTFGVQWKDADAVSSEFDEPMPHAVYFAPGGIAFHEGSLVSTSNGCVHLGRADARAFFDALAPGDAVTLF